MERIILHGPAVDAAGQFRDAGTELRVVDATTDGDTVAVPEPLTISSKRADELIERNAAVDPDANPDQADATDPADQAGEAVDSRANAAPGDADASEEPRDPLDHDGNGRKGGSKPGQRRR